MTKRYYVKYVMSQLLIFLSRFCKHSFFSFFAKTTIEIIQTLLFRPSSDCSDADEDYSVRGKFSEMLTRRFIYRRIHCSNSGSATEEKGRSCSRQFTASFKSTTSQSVRGIVKPSGYIDEWYGYRVSCCLCELIRRMKRGDKYIYIFNPNSSAFPGRSPT